MRELTGKRYWLVGASEGLGRALAHALSKAGVELVLTARNAERLQALADELPGKAEVVTADVADRASVKAAAKAAGDIDGMVYLAGVYWPIKATEWNAEQVEAMANINFTGGLRAIGAVVPGMLARGTGHIVITGSLSGFRGLPGAVGYGASKAGLMSAAESLHADLRGTGIDVQVANPGFIKTRLTDKNDFSMPFLMTAEAAADEMLTHMYSDNFKKSFPFLFGAMFRLSQFLPDWAYYRIFRG